jgi:uncharacterized protein (TIGR02996 family)
MVTESDFLEAILNGAEGDAARLVFADWLEERGDPRARAVRDRPEIFRFIARLRLPPCSPWDPLNQWVADGQGELLVAMASFLRASLGFIRNPEAPRLPQLTLDQLVNALALTPGRATAEAVLQAVSEQGGNSSVSREFASKLAAGQTPEVLLELLDRHRDEAALAELWACLLQEMVIRGVRLDDKPIAKWFGEKLRRDGHPLARQPLHLTPIEDDVPQSLPRYSVGGMSQCFPFGPSREGWGEGLPDSGRHVPVLEEVSEESVCRRIEAAVRDWGEMSNARLEARVFRATRPLTQDDLSATLLRALPLDCLEGAEVEGTHAEQVSASQAFAILFSAASGGCAYSRGLLGAYGRLEAWRSMGGLVGSDADNVGGIADRARRCLWVRFNGPYPWYDQVAWDIGLLAVRPDGMSLAVLAATDTD